MRTPPPEIVAKVFANMRPNRVKDEDGKVRRVKRTLSKGKFERRYIAQTRIDGVEYAYHATKGWRSRYVGV